MDNKPGESQEKFFELRKQNVRSFILSYLTLKQLSETDGDETEPQQDLHTTVEPVKPNPFDENLAVGQIRCLADTEQPTYVVLLKRWGDDMFIVMPFSHFRYPATDEEFKTKLDGGFWMQVLQAWNTRTLFDKTLKRSWLECELPQEDLDNALLLWQSTISDVELPDDLLKRTGLPIYHRDDPRLEYQRDEIENFAKVDAKDLALLDA